MTVAPLIAMKSTKCESLEAVGKELDRRAHTYANDVESLLDAMDSEDELSRSLRESEERLDGLRWQLKTSPESSRREVRGMLQGRSNAIWRPWRRT